MRGDSVNAPNLFLTPTSLTGGQIVSERKGIVQHSIHGKFGIRTPRWKLLLTPGSGGWSSPKDAEAHAQGQPDIQLYDMQQDVSEQKNLQAEHPEVVSELTKLLEHYVAHGRSTNGKAAQNDVDDIDLWKRGTK